MADLVENVLLAAAEKQAAFKPTLVNKDIDLEYDLGNMLAVDTNATDMKSLRSKKDNYLQTLARENTQLLLNQIWDLPVETVEDTIVGKLPEPSTRLPREKRIPKHKATTKWEEYAQLKGIQNRKKGRKVWDDELKEWAPRWGYKSKNDEKRDWVLEVPQNADPYEDQFEKKRKEKKERRAKNELQRLRNISRNMKGKVPGVGLTPTESGTPDKDHLSRALAAAKKSDASLGRFSTKVKDEDKKAAKSGKKRKFESNTGDITLEKKRALDILSRLHSDAPIIDKTRAGNMQMNQEQRSGSQKGGGKMNSKGKGGKKGKGGGGGLGGKGGKGKKGKSTGGQTASKKYGKGAKGKGKR